MKHLWNTIKKMRIERGDILSNKTKSYFSVKELKGLLNKPPCNWLFLLGERSNGKSYATKSYLISEAYKSIKDKKCTCQFAFIRRFDMESKDSATEPYFADMPIQEITGNEYTCISVYRKRIYLANVNDKTGKVERGVCIGYCFALASAEHYKSLIYPNVKYLIFEEFISERNQYLTQQEPQRLQQLVSTILRDRKGVLVLIGNTLSRLCPYYTELGLTGVEAIELNETKMYKFEDTTIKVHRCDTRNVSSGMFFGQAKKNITQGEYTTQQQPHLDGKLEDYNIVHQIVLEYSQFKYLMRFLYSPIDNYYVWYIEPKTTPIKDNTRVISNMFNPSPYYTNDFRGINELEARALKYIDLKKVVFSDNLTGTEFYNIIDKMDV